MNISRARDCMGPAGLGNKEKQRALLENNVTYYYVLHQEMQLCSHQLYFHHS